MLIEFTLLLLTFLPNLLRTLYLTINHLGCFFDKLLLPPIQSGRHVYSAVQAHFLLKTLLLFSGFLSGFFCNFLPGQ
ncbi:MAG: hypothetical protein JWQ38_1543 [Flavipsychrobacter sp.]|nr:hypothetical protein [Flavipsychrobacter sp.]